MLTVRIWIVTFVLLFAAAEFYQWIRQVTIPLPLFILGGVGLAIASNYGKRGIPFGANDPSIVVEAGPVSAPSSDRSIVVEPSSVAPSPATSVLPEPQPSQSISFVIAKPESDQRAK